MTREGSNDDVMGGPTGDRIARRTDGTVKVASVATLFPADPVPTAAGFGAGPGSGPGRGESARTDPRSIQAVVLAATLILALAASAGVAVLWSANRKLAGEVDAAVAQSEAAHAQAADLRVALEELPDAEAFDGLTGRVAGVEAWTGLPDDGMDGMLDLQTRLLEVSNGIDGLESSWSDDLGTVRSDLNTVRNDLSGRSDGASSADVEALRGEIGDLRGAVDGLRRDVGTLCWALGYRADVNASC